VLARLEEVLPGSQWEEPAKVACQLWQCSAALSWFFLIIRRCCLILLLLLLGLLLLLLKLGTVSMLLVLVLQL
jgi:hypothetical protein